MIYRSFSLILFLFIMISTSGQKDASFHPPLKIPMYLSGNFGEIRTDHFHSGIDIKTQGRTGHQVFSVEEGYVSRIKVQANGYGKSIYISHPNGYTSVYGHLDRYRDDIADFVRQMQYKQKSHTVDLYLDAASFPVEKGEFVAYSGNSGSSSGPHLHFEIRTTSNQHPTNVLGYNFDVKDRLPPRFHSLYLYPMNRESQVNGEIKRFSSQLVRENGTYTIPYGTRLDGSGTLGISVEVFDYLDGAINRCGIYTLEMYVDNSLSYRHVMDEFSFSETRYINAHIDFEERSISGKKAHRLHRLPNDRLRIYKKDAEGKALQISENRDYPIRIVATDVAGNTSNLEFILKGRVALSPVPPTDTGTVIPMKYNRSNSFREGPVEVLIPANTLYQDMDFTFGTSPAADGSLTPFYHIASSKVPVHTSYTLSITCPDLDPSLHRRLLLISRDSEGDVIPAGGEFKHGRVVAEVRNFGDFALALDTLAPVIRRQQNQAWDYTGWKEMRFTITDDLSGIESYEAYIDNQWALFEYDPKNNLLLYSFDENRIRIDSEHELELYVTDAKGNVGFLHTKFNW